MIYAITGLAVVLVPFGIIAFWALLFMGMEKLIYDPSKISVAS